MTKDTLENKTIILMNLFILLVLNTMVRTQFDILEKIGNLSIILTFIVMFVFLIKGFINRRVYEVNLNNVYIALFLFGLIYTISFTTTDLVDVSHLFKLLMFFLFILGAIRIEWKPVYIKGLAYILGLALIFIFFHWVKLDFPDTRFRSIFRNPNYLAVFLFVILYFKLIAIKYGSNPERIYFSILILLNLLLIYNTNTRSVLAGMGVILVSWIVMKVYPRIFPYLFHMIILINVAFLIVYVGLYNTALGSLLNNISIQLFGKDLYSGRAEIWQQVISAALNKPIFGYGLGINADDVTDIDLTSHNQYLQTLLEVGLVGFAVFLFLIYSIWKLLIKRSDSFAAKLSACFFLGILVYENFELTLFQNNYSIAFFQWLIMTIGISFSYSYKKDDGNLY